MNAVGIWLRERGALRVEYSILVDPKVGRGAPTPELLVSTSRPPSVDLQIESTSARVDIVL
jgi:hypothetical protein